MISITDTELEATLKELLQQNLQFTINEKAWKTGKFLFFKQNIFHIELHLQNKKREKIDIPFPFDIIKSDGSIIFSYKLKSLIWDGKIVSRVLETTETKNKYFNNHLEIKIL